MQRSFLRVPRPPTVAAVAGASCHGGCGVSFGLIPSSPRSSTRLIANHAPSSWAGVGRPGRERHISCTFLPVPPPVSPHCLPEVRITDGSVCGASPVGDEPYHERTSDTAAGADEQSARPHRLRSAHRYRARVTDRRGRHGSQPSQPASCRHHYSWRARVSGGESCAARTVDSSSTPLGTMVEPSSVVITVLTLPVPLTCPSLIV